MTNTIRVRIAVAALADGSWNAAGWGGPDSGDPAAQALAYRALEPFFGDPPVVWVEAEIPLPEPVPAPVTVQGVVTGTEGRS